MRPAELHNLSEDELEEKLAEAKEELFNLRFQVVTGQLDNPMRIKQVRRDVARILTVLRQREIGVHEGGSVAEPAAVAAPRIEAAAEGEPEAPPRKRRLGRKKA